MPALIYRLALLCTFWCAAGPSIHSAQAQAPDRPVVYCDSTLEAARREASALRAHAVTQVAREEALRLYIQASDRAQAERIRVWREQHPGAEALLPGAVLIDVSCGGHTSFIGNN